MADRDRREGTPPEDPTHPERASDAAPDLARTVTILLRGVRSGEIGAQDRLFRLVYGTVRRMAQAQLHGMRRSLDLEGTSLANAACLRLLERGGIDAEDRRHFYFIVARAIRDVLVETIRAHDAGRRGGDRLRVPLVDMAGGAMGEAGRADVLWLHEAVDRLLEADEVAGRVVLLRFYAERTLEETADILGIPVSRVRREWDYAKAWLRERFDRDGDGRVSPPPGASGLPRTGPSCGG